MGANDCGQLGTRSTADTNELSRVEGLPSLELRGLSCGGEFTCAHSWDALYCWGDNRYGQLGIDPSVMEMSTTPIRIDLAPLFNTRRL